MIRIRQIKINIEDNQIESLKNKVSKLLKISLPDILELKIIKKSLDARKKENLFFVYEVDIKTKLENKILKNNKNKDIFLAPVENYTFVESGTKELSQRPIIVGA